MGKQSLKWTERKGCCGGNLSPTLPEAVVSIDWWYWHMVLKGSRAVTRYLLQNVGTRHRVTRSESRLSRHLVQAGGHFSRGEQNSIMRSGVLKRRCNCGGNLATGIGKA